MTHRGESTLSDLWYLEETMRRLVEELKKNNCLRQDFEFLTKAERESKLERFIDDFIYAGER